MKKSTIFNILLLLFAGLTTANAQTVQGSSFKLTTKNALIDDWHLQYVNLNQLEISRNGTQSILRLANSGVFVEKPLIANQGIGIGTAAPVELLEIPNGFAKTKGYIVHSASTDKSDWDAPWYGLSLGGANAISLSASGTAAKPVVMQGFYGIAFRTYSGKMTMDSKGIVTMGLGDAQINQITAAPTNDYQLYVGKGIRTEKVKVDAQGAWPDYVFEKEYALRPLSEVENFIAANNHLPDVPSAADIQKNGIDMAEMDATLLRKIEELTLYILQQQQQITALTAIISSIKQDNHDKKE